MACVSENAYDPNHMKKSTSTLPFALQNLLPISLHGLCTATSVKKGSLLFQTGKKPQGMFFVVDGEVTLERLRQQGDPVVLQRKHRQVIQRLLPSDELLTPSRLLWPTNWSTTEDSHIGQCRGELKPSQKDCGVEISLVKCCHHQDLFFQIAPLASPDKP